MICAKYAREEKLHILFALVFSLRSCVCVLPSRRQVTDILCKHSPNMHSSILLTAASMLCSYGTAASASRFTFYDMKTPEAGPCNLTTGPDGAIWVQDFLVNKIARIDVNTGDVEEYDIPYTNNPLSSAAHPSVDGRTALACASSRDTMATCTLRLASGTNSSESILRPRR